MIKDQKRKSIGTKINTVFNPMKNFWLKGDKSTLQDSYSVLEPLAWLWRIGAIFPFVTKGPVGCRKYVFNKYLGGYCIFIFCIYMEVFTQVYYIYEQALRRRSVLTIVMLFLRTCASYICDLALVLSLIFHRQKFQLTMESLASQDTFLRQLGCRMHYNLTTKRIIIIMTIVAIIMSLQSSIDFIVLIIFRSRSITLWVAWSLPLIVYVLSVTLFACLIIMIGTKFRTINESLNVMIAKSNASSPKALFVTSDLAEKVCLIAEIHHNLCEVTININYIFNWNLVLGVLMSFVDLTIILYYIFSEIKSDQPIHYVRSSVYFFWGVIHTMTIFLIATTCNWTRNQAAYAARLVHRININNVDEDLYHAVQSFSLQMHHQKVALSGGGFFPLDLTLLRSIAAAVTTYLVILMQIETPAYSLNE